MADNQTAINPEVVAQIAGMVKSTLDKLNEEFGNFQSNVLDIIKDAWYNENAIKVMPDAAAILTSVSGGINDSLASLGSALGKAVNDWSAANGGSYSVPAIEAAKRTMTCNVSDNKNGFRGMDLDDISSAISNAVSSKSNMLDAVNTLRNAGETEGFRGGGMQEALNEVCGALTKQITDAVDKVIESISSNTGTAKSNVEQAQSGTVSTFQIK